MNDKELFKDVFGDDYKVQCEVFLGKDYNDENVKFSDLNLVDIYYSDILKYPLLTREQEVELGKKLKLRNDILILKEREDINIRNCLIVDLERVFVSITNKEVKDYVLNKLRYYYLNNGKQESYSNKIVKYYLDEYEKLCKISDNGIPTVDELNDYFKDKKYAQFNKFDGNKMISLDDLREQVDMFSQYMIARDLLVNCNFRLVTKFAKSLCDRSMEYLDCINEGNLGLMRAVEDWDVERGYKFSTYASNWIYQYIARAKNDKGTNIRIPVYLHELKRKIESVESEFFVNNGRYPTDFEIAEIVDWPLNMVISAKKAFYRANCFSLNTLIGEEMDSEVLDLVPDVNSVSAFDELLLAGNHHDLVRELLEVLNDKELNVIQNRFGLNSECRCKTLQEIGDSYGVTHEAIRLTEKKALKKLKKMSRYFVLEDYGYR